MDVLTEMIATAVRRHQEGDLAQAEALDRRILERQPDHPGALHLLGVLAHQQGHDDRAVDLIARAIALRAHDEYNGLLNEPTFILASWALGPLAEPDEGMVRDTAAGRAPPDPTTTPSAGRNGSPAGGDSRHGDGGPG